MSNNVMGFVMLPTKSSLGVDLMGTVIEQTLVDIADRFGGFTALPAMGGWVSPEGELIKETVLKVEVSAAWDSDDYLAFRDIALRYGYAAAQNCVMIYTPRHHAELLKPETPAYAVAAE